MTCLHWDLLYTTKHTHEVFWCLLTLNWTSCLMALNAVAKVGHFFHNSSKGNTVGTSVHTQQSPAALAVKMWEPHLSPLLHYWAVLFTTESWFMLLICWTALSMLCLSEFEMCSSSPVAVHVLSIHAQGTWWARVHGVHSLTTETCVAAIINGAFPAYRLWVSVSREKLFAESACRHSKGSSKANLAATKHGSYPKLAGIW